MPISIFPNIFPCRFHLSCFSIAQYVLACYVFWVSLTTRDNMKIVIVINLVLFDEKLFNYFSFENEDIHVPTFVDTTRSNYVRTFQKLDLVKLDHVEHDGCCKSKNVEVWVAKVFDEFQKFT